MFPWAPPFMTLSMWSLIIAKTEIPCSAAMIRSLWWVSSSMLTLTFFISAATNIFGKILSGVSSHLLCKAPARILRYKVVTHPAIDAVMLGNRLGQPLVSGNENVGAASIISQDQICVLGGHPVI